MRKKGTPQEQNRSPAEQNLINKLEKLEPDQLRDFGKKMLLCFHRVEKTTIPAEQRMIDSIKKMTRDERKEFKRRLFDIARSMLSARRSPAITPKDEAAIELYAVKSFQAQDMSGRFNPARMDAALRAAKPKLEERTLAPRASKKKPPSEPSGPS